MGLPSFSSALLCCNLLHIASHPSLFAAQLSSSPNILTMTPLFTPAVSVILAYFVSSDGSSNWLLGLQLCGTYCLVAAVFLLARESPAVPGAGAGGEGDL